MPAFGIYLGLRPGLLLGAKIRAGMLANRPPTDVTMSDPGAGGLVSGTLALRATPARAIPALPSQLWLELAAGPAITGDLVRPTYEVAAGWSFSIGRVRLGPSIRYLQVQQFSDPLDSRSAHVALVGIDVGFAAPRPGHHIPVIITAPARRPLSPRPPAPPHFTADGDRLVDMETPCPLAAPQHDEGCSMPDDIIVHDDRIVLPERVLFDENRARVKHRGRKLLRNVVDAWNLHPEWLEMHIEGHTDIRGPDDYNQWLSELRAERVRRVLVGLGIDEGRLSAVGFGKTRPIDPGHSEAAHQRNRRVELIIITRPGEQRDSR